MNTDCFIRVTALLEYLDLVCNLKGGGGKFPPGSATDSYIAVHTKICKMYRPFNIQNLSVFSRELHSKILSSYYHCI